MSKKALVLLNMGAARDKEELKIFLLNMFNDINIIGIKNRYIRSLVANIIVFFRHNKAWENYKKIDGRSPLHKLTKQLTNKLNLILPDYYTTTVMRYTEPFSIDVIDKLSTKGIKDVVLLPLYPQYSTTTSKSSLDDFISQSSKRFNIKIIEPFYKNKLYNEAIINNITLAIQDRYEDYHLIFSAHGLPQKIINKGDPYENQIKQNVKILEDMLNKKLIKFKSISLAYQSKVGPMKWLTPSLDTHLQKFENKNIIIYPISFIVDNSETVFELDIEYRDIAKNIGINDYKVVKCLNDSDMFCDAIKNIILSS